MGRLDGCAALVTGASSGIGLACATRFAGEGATVRGVDLQDSPGWKSLEQRWPGSRLETADVRDEEAVASVVGSLASDAGRVDVVVNAAGVAGGAPVHLLDAAEWDRVLDVNLKGTFLVCKHALARMVAQRSGSIVNIASIEGLEGIEAASAYNASKGGVVVLTKNMAIDYGRVGVRINCICPGFVETPLLDSAMGLQGELADRCRAQHALGRFARPEEIAGAALFLASQDSSFVTGHALVVDGGFTAGARLGVGEAFGLV